MHLERSREFGLEPGVYRGLRGESRHLSGTRRVNKHGSSKNEASNDIYDQHTSRDKFPGHMHFCNDVGLIHPLRTHLFALMSQTMGLHGQR